MGLRQELPGQKGDRGGDLESRWKRVGRPNRDPLSTGLCSSGRWGPHPAVVLCGCAAVRLRSTAGGIGAAGDAFSGRGSTAVFEGFARGSEEAGAAEGRDWATGLGSKGPGRGKWGGA